MYKLLTIYIANPSEANKIKLQKIFKQAFNGSMLRSVRTTTIFKS